MNAYDSKMVVEPEAAPSGEVVRKQRALRLMRVLGFLVAGLAAAVMYHTFQGLVFSRGYPWDTLFFLRSARFSDFTDVLRSARQADPYAIWSLYFPFTYVLFRPLTWFSWTIGFFLTFYAAFRVLITHAYQTFLPIVRARVLAGAAAVVLCLFTYPPLSCTDRGNIEVILAALAVLFTLDVTRGRDWRAILWIVPAISLKLYPAALLALYLPRKRIVQIVAAILACALLTVGSLALFAHSPTEELEHWSAQLDLFNEQYVIGNRAMGGTAGAWNPLKLVYLYTTSNPDERIDRVARPLADPEVRAGIEKLLGGYAMATLLVALYLAYHVWRIEPDPSRQAVLLLVFIVIATPGAADYKMIYVVPAMVFAIALTDQRPWERAIVPLLALVLIPKRYYFLPHIRTDSNVEDVAIAVFVNPAALMAVMVLLIAGAYRARTPAASV